MRTYDPDADAAIARELRERAQPLERDDDLDPLIERVGDAPIVLLGEASHGTSEFYTWRARITRRLIEERGFDFIAVEGDWPACRRIDHYIRGSPAAGEDPHEVLRAFDRWPTWMWANEEVADLMEWLRDTNDCRPPDERVGFYGLDVYSLWESLHAVRGYLQDAAPETLESAERAFRCFEPYGEDAQRYAQATWLVPTSCEEDVVALLREMQGHAAEGLGGDDLDARFDAEQNAHVATNAEGYYRAMVKGGPASWNLRDTHMMDTLDRLLERLGPDAKAIVWAHNTHIGDARATDMAGDGMTNLGQLARERHGLDDTVLVGFSTFEGRVIAGRAWDAPMGSMRVPPATPGSVEHALHEAGVEDKLLLFDKERPLREAALAGDPMDDDGATGLLAPRGHRAIGVVYHPDRERYGNYVPSVLPLRYDALLHIERTTALKPLHVKEVPEHEPPETFPWGF